MSSPKKSKSRKANSIKATLQERMVPSESRVPDALHHTGKNSVRVIRAEDWASMISENEDIESLYGKI